LRVVLAWLRSWTKLIPSPLTAQVWFVVSSVMRIQMPPDVNAIEFWFPRGMSSSW